MKKWLVALIPIIIIVGLISWRVVQKKSEASAQLAQMSARSNAPASVELVQAQKRSIVSTYEATGTIEPILNVNISPRITGRVEFLQVREGDAVKQGQVLVRIDQSQIAAEVRQQQANLAEAKYRLAQAQLTLTTTDASVTTQIRQHEANVASAEADLRQAKTTHTAQYESAKASVEDAQNKIDAAKAAVENAEASIKSAQASLDNSKAKYDRALGLFDKGYVSAQDVEDAKTTVSVQQSQLETAQGQLRSAKAQLSSTMTQKRSVEQQADIIRAKADADLDAAKAKVEQAKAGLDYAKASAKQSPAYRQSLEALKAGVEASQASLDSSKAKQQDTVLRSPIDGVVTARNIDPGSLASAGQTILSVQALNKVWVTVYVPEDVSVKLRLNQPADVTIDSLGGRTFESRIAQINPSADTQSRQYAVRTIMENSNKLFTAGMFAKVSLVIDRTADVLAVPREAIHKEKDGSNYVIVAGKDQTAEFRQVTTGSSDAKWIAVTGDLAEGEKVVTMSASNVREGQKLSAGGNGGRPGGGFGDKKAGGKPKSRAAH